MAIRNMANSIRVKKTPASQFGGRRYFFVKIVQFFDIFRWKRIVLNKKK